MKIFLMICWRNLWRHKRRSLVVISSVALGIFAMLISLGILNGVMTQMVDNTISTSLGHISLQKKGFRDNMRLEYSFMPDETVKKALGGEKIRIRAFAPRVKVQGMIRSSEASRSVLVVGVDPERERRVSRISHYTVKEGGSSYLTSPGSSEILISRSMAEKLDLVPGDRLVLMIQDRRGQIVGSGMIVKGIFQSPVDMMDRFVVFVGLERLQEITGLQGKISEINAVLYNREDVPKVKSHLLAVMGDSSLTVLSWMDMAPFLVSSIRIVDVMMYVSFAIIFITIIFSIANTLIMAIMERFHEIGVMKSIGTKPSWIFFMILFEALNLGVLGLAAGIAAGLFGTALMNVTGLDLSFGSESLRVIGSGSVIYPAVKGLDILMAGLIVLVTTVAAALLPARKAARINPLNALTYI